jgi:glycolate oxidase
MADVLGLFTDILGDEGVVAGEQISEDYEHDEALSSHPVRPEAVLLPRTTEDVSAILRTANEHGIPVTARGAGSGISGAAIPVEGGVIVSFERMNAIIEIDVDNHVAVVEPGVRLAQLDEALAPHGFVYPVRPGESSASIGGTVNTNAAGMRAVKYGVTRHHVIGLEVVLPSGEVIHTGGKIVKVSSGYDLTQLIIGSEGTLGLVTKVWIKLSPRLPKGATVLAPFATLDEVTSAIPKILASGLQPLILEYIDLLTMMVIVMDSGIELGISDEIRQTALAYLVVSLEDNHEDRLEQDTVALGELLAGELGALDVFVLPQGAASDLIQAREHAFYAAKTRGFHDVIDVVVPRAKLPDFVRAVGEISQEFSSGIVGCGHAGDGNVHMAVLQEDPEIRNKIMHRLLSSGLELGGAISGEHGIGRMKKPYFLAYEDPTKVDLMRGIKRVFDPNGILNPGVIFD